MTTDPRDHLPTPLTPPTPDEQYLWDGTGQPDASTTRLESALRPLRYSGDFRAPPATRNLRPLAIAAALLLAGIGSYLLFNRGNITPTPQPAPPAAKPTWTIAVSQGGVDFGDPHPMNAKVTLRDLTVSDNGRVTLNTGSSSSVQVEGAAKVQLAYAENQYPWLTISQGNVFAQVAHNDSPIMLGVHGNAVTLKPGAAASLDVKQDDTHLTCKTGEAVIDWPRVPTRVLGPASCEISARTGPALPLPAAASKEACGVIEKLDDVLPYAMKDPKSAENLLMSYLDQSKPSDAPTLWNLLYRVPQDFRRPVRDALARHIHTPKLDPDLILKLDPAAMDAWWEAAVEAAK